MKEAVLVLDMTRDSMAPEARAVEKRRAILPQAAAYLKWARGKGTPVVFVCSARRRTDRWFLKFWELANEIWTPGQEPIPELFEREKDTVVHKRRYSGFFCSDLELTLRELGVDALQLIGWSTSLAVATTAVDAWQLGFPTTVVRTSPLRTPGAGTRSRRTRDGRSTILRRWRSQGSRGLTN